MSKLDEIEARIIEQQKQAGIAGEVPVVIHDDEGLLLIRAVRQLGNLDVHLMGRDAALKEGMLDADVLALISPDQVSESKE